MNVILVDAMHLCYRCAYAYKDLKTSQGLRSGVAHGFLSNVVMLAGMFPKSAIIFCWDHGTSWRKSISPSYKSKRGNWEVRDHVFSEVSVIRDEFLSALGFRHLFYPSVEGDDCVSLLVHKFQQRPDVYKSILIYSGDKDFHQLIGGNVKIIRHSKEGMDIIDEQAVMAHHGVAPKDWVKLRALMGDASDGLVGVKGVGPKTATTLLMVGIDPSISNSRAGKNLDIKMQQRLDESWIRVRMNYRLSLLPKDPSEIQIDKHHQASLSAIVDDLVLKPWRLEAANNDGFVNALIRYELAFIYSKRRQFFDFL